MTRSVEAEYFADERILKLARPLDGVSDHAVVSVIVSSGEGVDLPAEWPSLEGEAGHELARAVRDAFGREEIEV